MRVHAPKSRGGSKAENALEVEVAGRAALAAVRAARRENIVFISYGLPHTVSLLNLTISSSSITHLNIPVYKMASIRPLHSNIENAPPDRSPPALSSPPVLPLLATPLNTPAFSTAPPLAMAIRSPEGLLVSTTASDEPTNTNMGFRSRLGEGKSSRGGSSGGSHNNLQCGTLSTG